MSCGHSFVSMSFSSSCELKTHQDVWSGLERRVSLGPCRCPRAGSCHHDWIGRLPAVVAASGGKTAGRRRPMSIRILQAILLTTAVDTPWLQHH